MNSLIILLIPVAAFGAAGETTTLARPLDAWSASAQSIWCYDVTLHAIVETFWAPDNELVLVVDDTIRQRYMQGSWRVDQVETNHFYKGRQPDRWKVSSGEVLAYAHEAASEDVRFFNSTSNFAQHEQLVGFSRGKLLVPQLYETFRAHFYGQSFEQMLRPRLQDARSTRIGTTVTLTFPPAPDPVPMVNEAKTLFEITLDAAKGYMPARIKSAPNPTGAPDLVDDMVNELVLVDGGLWIPAITRLTIHCPAYTGDAAIPMSVVRIELDLGRSTFNTDIHPDVFRLPFPPGAVVYDKDQRRNFVQAEGGEKDYEAYDEFVKSRFRGGGEPRVFPRMTLVLLAANAAVIAALTLGLWARKRRRKAREAST